MRPEIDHDRLFKELLTTFFVEFLDLFFPQVVAYIEPDSVTFLDKEVFTDVTEGERYEADLVARVRFRPQEGEATEERRESFFLIHVENQSKAQGDFARRMFRYFSRLLDAHGLPVYPIGVFSYDAPLRAEPNEYRVAFPDLQVLGFEFRVIQLNRLSWRSYVNRQNPVASALTAKMEFPPEERPRVKLECLRLLATLRLNPAKTQLISGFIDTYLRLSAEEVRMFEREAAAVLPPPEREGVMQIVTSWMEQGIEQGIERVVVRQLGRRLGALSEADEARIHALDTPALEELGDALLDFSAPEDLGRWLDAHPTATPGGDSGA